MSTAWDEPSGRRRTLMVCDAGGHLVEADVVRALLYPDSAVRYYTADTLMSRSMLDGADAVFARRRVLPRRPDLVLAEFVTALSLLRRWRPDEVVSTGSAVALAWLAAARVLRIRAVFHESATRIDDLSTTGKLMTFVPGVERFTQARRTRRGWTPVVSSLSIAERIASTEPAPPTRTVFVTVGTYEFPFDRLLRRIDEVVPPDWTIVWQVGHSDGYTPTRGEVHRFLPYDDMVSVMERAEVIVTHAGVGSVLTALQAGRIPLVVARLERFGEHVDDHQSELAAEVGRFGIPAVMDVDELTAAIVTTGGRHLRDGAPPASAPSG